MTDERKHPIAPWILAAALALPFLYVLSSGPMQMLAFRSHVTVAPAPAPAGGLAATCEIDVGVWWPIVYAPLLWVSDQEWGEPLLWYWDLFPLPAPDP